MQDKDVPLTETGSLPALPRGRYVEYRPPVVAPEHRSRHRARSYYPDPPRGGFGSPIDDPAPVPPRLAARPSVSALTPAGTAGRRPGPASSATTAASARPAPTASRPRPARPRPALATTPASGSATPPAKPPRRRRVALVATILASALAVLVASSAAAGGGPGGSPEVADPVELSGFVEASDGNLVLGGKPFLAVGFNDYRLVAEPGGYVCDEGTGEFSDELLAAQLDRARAAGATVIRTWFFQSSWDPDGDGEGRWSAFDRVIDAASARGIRVIPALANHWGDCENGAPDKDLDFYAGGFREPAGPYALSYLDYARLVAERYADSPAIAYWDLINEPEAPAADGSCDEAAAAAALGGFADEASTAIREADPNHLISFGTIGGGQCGIAGGDYLSVQASLDICEVHLYDGPETGTSPTTPLPDPAAQALASCGASGKPLVAGEVGFAADLDETGAPAGEVSEGTLAARAGLLDARLAALREAGADGYLLWQLSPEEVDPEHDPYAIAPCDPAEVVLAAHSPGAAHGGAPSPAAGCEAAA